VLAGEEDKSGLGRFAITMVQLTDPALVQNTDHFVANDGLPMVEPLVSRTDGRIAWPWRDRSASQPPML